MIKIKKHKTDREQLNIHGWEGRVIHAGKISINTLAALCSEHSTVTRADALAVIEALLTECTNALKQGHSVSLGDLGSLHLTVSSKTSETIEEWNVGENIKRVNIRYTPSIALKNAISIGADKINLRIVD